MKTNDNLQLQSGCVRECRANGQARCLAVAQVMCLCAAPPSECSTCLRLKQWRWMNGRIISICLNYIDTACNFHCTSYIYKLLDNNLALRGSTAPLTVACPALLERHSHCTGISTALRVTSKQMIYRLTAPTDAQFCVLCSLLLIWSMWRCNCLPQGAYINVVNTYSRELLLL